MDRLLNELLAARGAMRAELQRRPPVLPQQTLTRRRLLHALEAYAQGLTARGLSAPPNLRDELNLQRRLDGQH